MVSVLTSASIDNHVKWLQREIAAAAEQLHGLEAALHLTAVLLLFGVAYLHGDLTVGHVAAVPLQISAVGTHGPASPPSLDIEASLLASFLPSSGPPTWRRLESYGLHAASKMLATESCTARAIFVCIPAPTPLPAGFLTN